MLQRNSISELFELFLSTKSEQTKIGYRWKFDLWIQFLKDERDEAEIELAILTATTIDAIRFLELYKKRIGMKSRYDGSTTITDATLMATITPLRSFYKFLIDNERVVKNPFNTDIFKKLSPNDNIKRPTLAIPDEKVREICNLPSKYSKYGKRGRAFFALLFGGGLRLREALSLHLGDIRRSNSGTLYLRLRRTKGKQDTNHSLPTWAAEEITIQMNARKNEGASDADFLLAIYHKGGSTSQEIWHPANAIRYFKECCAKVGLPPHFSPHSARATAITKMIRDGHHHSKVKEFSRHKSVAMVERYEKLIFDVDTAPQKDLKY